MTRRSAGVLLALMFAVGCSDPSKPGPAAEGSGGKSAGKGGGDAGPPADGPPPAEQVIAVSIAGDGQLGAAAMEQAVAIPLEESVARVPGVTLVRSVSGAQRVDADFTLAARTDPTAAMGAIQAAVTAAAPRLPAGISPPEVRLRPARRVWLVASSETWTQDAMASARDRIAAALARLTGVRSVVTCGTGDPVIRVLVDGRRLAALGLDLARVQTELARAGASGVRTIEDLAGAVIATAASGAVVAVRDVAVVERGMSASPCAAQAGGRSALSIEVGLDSGDAAATARFAEEVGAIAASLPQDARLVQLAPAGVVVELHVDPPAGIDPARMRALGESTAAKISSVEGVTAVVVESGDLPAGAGSLAPLHARALVGVAAPAAAADRVIAAVTAAAQSPDASVRVTGPDAPAPILIQGDDLEPLHEAAEAITAALTSTPGVAAAGVSGAALVARARVEPDRDRLAAHGLQPADVAAAIALARNGARVGEMIEGDRRIPIRLEVAGQRSAMADPVAIAALLPSLRVRSAKKKGLVALSSLVAVTLASEPAHILRHQRRRAVEIWWRPAPDAPADQEMAVRRAVDAVRLPAGIAVARP